MGFNQTNYNQSWAKVNGVFNGVLTLAFREAFHQIYFNTLPVVAHLLNPQYSLIMISGSAVVGSMHSQFSSQYDVSVLMYELTYYIGLATGRISF